MIFHFLQGMLETIVYSLFSIVHEKGKARPIQWPKRRLQAVHARIHKLLSRVAVPAYLHSAVRGKSYVSNAAAHDPKMPTIKIDVKKFFPSVSRAVIFNFFCRPIKVPPRCCRITRGYSDFRCAPPNGKRSKSDNCVLFVQTYVR
jgi:hypothetical protein